MDDAVEFPPFPPPRRSREEAEAALELIRTWTAEVRLTLHPTKTHIVDATKDGFDFLGYHFGRGYRWPRKKSLDKFKDTIGAKTKRTAGQSLATAFRLEVPKFV